MLPYESFLCKNFGGKNVGFIEMAYFALTQVITEFKNSLPYDKTFSGITEPIHLILTIGCT